MIHDRFRRIGLATVAALFVLPVLIPGQALAQNGSDDVLNRLRATYASMDALRASFSQQVGARTIEGTVVLSGDRYRIEMPGQTIVSDGTTAWAYSEDDNQMLVNDHIDDVGSFSPSAFFSRYPDEFRVRAAGIETIRGARHDVLQLTPREENVHVRSVTLYVRSSDSLPTRVRIVDGQGTTLLFDLLDIQVNPRVTSDTFRMTPPPGAEVIDLRG